MKTKKPLPAFMKNIMDAKDKANAPKKGMTKMAKGIETKGKTKGKMIKMKSGGGC
jgi:hypothetical protein